MQLKTCLGVAAAAPLSLATVALIFGLSTAVSASPINVDFSFSTVKGTFTFNDGIGDGAADALSFSSDNFGEDSSVFPSPNSGIATNTFEWIGNQISSASFGIDYGFTDRVLNFNFTIPSAQGLGFLNCTPFPSPGSCGGTQSISGPIKLDTQVVPVPASLPLLIAGLAGLAMLRMRKTPEGEGLNHQADPGTRRSGV